MLKKYKKYRFLFEELVKRDFKKKYKRTVLGMGWSLVSPLLTLLVMRVVFTQFFGGSIAYYTTYLFAGNLAFSFFREATEGGMYALAGNADIFTKINVPKYMFLLSKNLSSVINFGITLVVFFIFVAIDGVPFSFSFLMIFFPALCLAVFNIGFGLILSALYVFFKDMQYLYGIFTLLLMYVSAIFYNVDAFGALMQRLFLLNPVYVYIKYIRVIIIDGTLPSLPYHLLCVFYAALFLFVGGLIYRKYNHRFLYYV